MNMTVMMIFNVLTDRDQQSKNALDLEHSIDATLSSMINNKYLIWHYIALGRPVVQRFIRRRSDSAAPCWPVGPVGKKFVLWIWPQRQISVTSSASADDDDDESW